MKRLRFVIFIAFMITWISGLGLAQNSGNILNLPGVGQPTPSTGQTRPAPDS